MEILTEESIILKHTFLRIDKGYHYGSVEKLGEISWKSNIRNGDQWIKWALKVKEPTDNEEQR